jgi:creatinine amidohydrolase/Fe(II)-dependent formamide hydrolase-like protein
MVLGVTPVIFSKFGVVVHPDKMHDTKRIDTNERMTAPNARNKGHAYHPWITIAVSPTQQMGNFAALEL